MSIVQIQEKREVTKPIEKLVEKVRNAANVSVGDLWGAFLEVGEMDMVRATDAALRLLVSCGDHIRAMKLLEGIYALVEIAPPEIFTACQRYPALSQMFMEEFLAESDEFIFDAGMPVLNVCLTPIDNDTAYIYIEKELQRISREALTQLGEKGIILSRTLTRLPNSSCFLNFSLNPRSCRHC